MVLLLLKVSHAASAFCRAIDSGRLHAELLLSRSFTLISQRKSWQLLSTASGASEDSLAAQVWFLFVENLRHFRFCKSHNELWHLQSYIWRATASSLISSHLPNLPSEIQIVRHCFFCNLLATFSRQSHLTTSSAFTAGVFAPSSLFPAQTRWILTRNRPLPVKSPTRRVLPAEKAWTNHHCLYHHLSHRRRQCHRLLPPLYTTTPMAHAGS
jgi:hypothetical protein